MFLQQFVDGSGELQFDEAFLSPRIVREALEKSFRLVVIEESAHQLRGKIVRYARIYAAPVLWPNATIRILFHREGAHFRLSWRFRWPDYYLLLLVPVLALLEAAKPPHFMDASLILTSNLCFAVLFLLLIFLDTKWVSWRVRRVLEKLEKKTP
jgi:hypothetical protein